jgi:hypothetical protein
VRLRQALGDAAPLPPLNVGAPSGNPEGAGGI